MISNYPIIGIKFDEKMDIFQIDTLFFSFASYPYIWLKHNQRSGWWQRWQRQWWWSGGGSEGKELWGWWRGPPGLSHWPRDERKMYSSHFPPFPLMLFSSKRATDTRTANSFLLPWSPDYFHWYRGTGLLFNSIPLLYNKCTLRHVVQDAKPFTF